jgi:hypothetical protein
MSEVVVWPVPRVEVPTRKGLVVVAVDQGGEAFIVTGPRGARLAPLHLEPDAPLDPGDGIAYLYALSDRYEGARLISNPSEEIERAPFRRRRGNVTVEMDALGGIVVTGSLSDRGRRWLTAWAVPSLRREEARLRARLRRHRPIDR